MGGTVNVGASSYTGKASFIRREMLVSNTLGKGDYPTVWSSVGAAAIGKISLTGSLTYTGSGDFIYGGQINFGGGLPAGFIPLNGALGVSNSWLLYDFWKK